MTFDQLEMLEAVILHGNYRAASEYLHKSQPSLSVGIKNLEEEFGISLFDRSEYRSQLTDQGKIFYQWAKQCLESFRSLSVVGKEMGNKLIEPTISIVLDPLVEFENIQTVFETCLGPKSATELKIRAEILGKGMELVKAKEATFAIGTIAKSHPEIESFPFKKIELIPVATKKVAENYRNFPQIIVSSPDTVGEMSKGPKCFVSDHNMKSKLIIGGFGWGRLAKHEIISEYKTKKLVSIKDPTIRSFHIDLCVMRNTTVPLGPLSKIIWSQLKSPSTSKHK
jgi:DNA-binding transcriptional LysR family regulator